MLWSTMKWRIKRVHCFVAATIDSVVVDFKRNGGSEQSAEVAAIELQTRVLPTRLSNQKPNGIRLLFFPMVQFKIC